MCPTGCQRIEHLLPEGAVWAELAKAHGSIPIVIGANMEEVKARGRPLSGCSSLLFLYSSAWKPQTTFLPQIGSEEVHSQATEVTPERVESS